LLCQFTTKCNHSFDLFCLKNWLEAHQSCPFCRETVDSKNHPELFSDPYRIDAHQVSFDCSTLSWGQVPFENLATALAGHKNLKSLRLTGHCFRKGDMAYLSSLLRIKTGIEHLDLSGLRLDEEDSELLAEGLRGNVGLRGLSLQNTGLSKSSAEALSDSIGDLQTLESLDLGLNNLGEAGASLILEALKRRKKPVQVDFRWNGIEEDDQEGLRDSLKKHPGIKVYWQDNIPPEQALEHLLTNAERILKGDLKSGEYSILHFTLRLKQALEKCEGKLKKKDNWMVKGKDYLQRLMQKNDCHVVTHHK